MRSMLFVPADSERKLARAVESGADALILDLEDSVAASNRPIARKQAREFLEASTNPRLEKPFDLRALRRYAPELVSGWTTEEPSTSLDESPRAMSC